MESIFRVALLLAGIVNLLPAALAFLPAKISASYGVAVPDANTELLLRHRAVLFGIVGGLLVFAALSRKHYAPAVVAGVVSMGSFVGLYFLLGGVNQELRRVMLIDVVALLVLVAGAAAFYLKR